MIKPPSEPRCNGKLELRPDALARGRVAFGVPPDKATDAELADALYWLSRQITLPEGGSKTKAALLAEFKRRGLRA